MLAPDLANEEKLQQWIAAASAADLPHLDSFARGLELDIKAATAAVTLPHHNGRTEGVNTKTKKIKRDMFGRADFELLRHRILLGLGPYRHHRNCDRAVEITVPPPLISVMPAALSLWRRNTSLERRRL